ncbi:MAG: hypothetical protein FWD21_02485, partial [Peptococcaceae bacterium]|nr:hypothetical protein [Peptococcaceae bacterium]
MRKGNKLLAVLFVIVMKLVLFTVFAPPATATSAAGLIAAINGSGLSLTAVSGGANTVIVTNTIAGDTAIITSTMALNIDSGVTVLWQANLSGPVNNYLFNLSGSGSFVVSDCTILNTGSKIGGAINVTGNGITVTVDNGGFVLSDMRGNAILVDAGNNTVNVNAGGTVRSLTNNTNAAIQVNNYSGNRINVAGGYVISDVGGYAINDGAGTGVQVNDTIIDISGGIVSSGSACAINSTGAGAKVIISDGVVSNTAASNANPTIYMNGSTGDNIYISGGTVINQASNSTSYAIQTTGNIEVRGGGVYTYAGRAINLVGMNSNATVSGGTVQALSTGTAICTATTNPGSVADSSVTVTSGLVSVTSGYAIRITGPNSVVNVSGGQISATTGVAIQADSSASRSNINLDGSPGGQVTATTGRAINTGANAFVNTGFVFAFGNSRNSVMSVGVLRPINLLGSGSVVCSWDNSSGRTTYGQNTSSDLIHWTGSGWNDWHNHPSLGGGIDYANGPLSTGFFPISNVTTVRDFGLIFNAADGILYMDGLFGRTVAPGRNDTWVGVASDGVSDAVLELRNFGWITRTRTALTIENGDVKIVLVGNSKLESTSDTGVSEGIHTNGNSVTISGAGTLITKASNIDSINSYGINLGTGSLTMENGTFIAQGGKSSIYWNSVTLGAGPVDNPFYHWTYS